MARWEGSGRNTRSTGTSPRTSSGRTAPRARPAKMAAPRRLAASGASTRSMVRSITSAWIWHHRSDSAPPPTMRTGSSRRLANRSTASWSHRLLKATPSRTARASSGRPVVSERLWNPARACRSSTGDRSPRSHGVNTTLDDPGAAAAASRVAASKSGRPCGPARPGTTPHSQSRQTPPASWLSAIRYPPVPSPGTLATCRRGIGLLERHRCTDPGAGAHGHVGLVLEHRTGPARRRVEVRRARDHLHAGREAEIGRHPREDGSDHRARAVERGQPFGVDARTAHQHPVVGQHVEVPVVGQPGAGHGSVGGRRDAGEAHGQVVDRLEEPPGLGRVPRLVGLQEAHVSDGIGPRGGRGPAGSSDPGEGGPRGIAGHRAGDDPPGVGRAPCVHPQHAGADGEATGVHGHRAGPLPGDADRHHPIRRDGPRAQRPSGRVPDDGPPQRGVLGGGVTVDAGGEGRVLVPDDRPGQGDQADLEPAGPEVDGQDEQPGVGGRPGRTHRSGRSGRWTGRPTASTGGTRRHSPTSAVGFPGVIVRTLTVPSTPAGGRPSDLVVPLLSRCLRLIPCHTMHSGRFEWSTDHSTRAGPPSHHLITHCASDPAGAGLLEMQSVLVVTGLPGSIGRAVSAAGAAGAAGRQARSRW